VYGAVSASKQLTDYIPLLDSAVYARTVSPLLAVQLTAYRPRFRYVSYLVSDYYGTYDSFGYVKTVSHLLLLQISVYRSKIRYAEYSAINYENIYDSVKAVKAVFARLGDVANVYAVFKFINRSAAFIEYVMPYESFKVRRVYVYNVSTYEGLYDNIKYGRQGYTYSSYEFLYEQIKAELD
jgi:hypothetical protein